MVYIGSLEYDEQIKTTGGIVIFGSGFLLPYLMKKLDTFNLSKKIIAICDNNTAVHGEKVAGISVMSPEYVFRKYAGADYIVYNQYFIEICKQLQENHIKRIHLIRQGSL